MIAIAFDPVEETYHDVKKMLYKLAWNATKRWGGDFEEYLSAANEGFMVAYNTYEKGKGAAFSTWVWWVVRGKIQAMVSPKKIDQMTVNAGEAIDLDIYSSRPVFDLPAFLSDLSQDTRQVVGLIVNSPVELLDICSTKDGPECLRSGLKEQLKEAGWTMARIMESFIELKDAIHD
ncbi:hypothetical protein LCGC14_3094720 [marine sediment metagenome]|uniref:RNA polymerase sigma-70 region 2 domain-containing protein n=1 Tax=marine sediment metagenome TaxID=412755 RepID=A0A0F8WYD9_9ZZZZ